MRISQMQTKKSQNAKFSSNNKLCPPAKQQNKKHKRLRDEQKCKHKIKPKTTQLSFVATKSLERLRPSCNFNQAATLRRARCPHLQQVVALATATGHW